MRGEISFVEYIVSTAIFIAFVSYILFNLLLVTPRYLKESENERMRAEAYQISELLINDPGEPPNWYQNMASIKRLGLLDETRNETNYLSEEKINKLGNPATGDYCIPTYDKVKEWLDSDYNFSLMLIERPSGTLRIYCVPPRIIKGPTNITIRRIVAFGSSYGELIIQMW